VQFFYLSESQSYFIHGVTLAGLLSYFYYKNEILPAAEDAVPRTEERVETATTPARHTRRSWIHQLLRGILEQPYHCQEVPCHFESIRGRANNRDCGCILPWQRSHWFSRLQSTMLLCFNGIRSPVGCVVAGGGGGAGVGAGIPLLSSLKMHQSVFDDVVSLVPKHPGTPKLT
jgi:hypothetical protein